MISLKKALLKAEKASLYAQERLIKVGTHLIHNSLEKIHWKANIYFNPILHAIVNEEKGIRAAEVKLNAKMADQDLDPRLRAYESNVFTFSKYSMGNCEELAIQAFHYLLNHESDITDASLYQIQNGDHYFLVLNRDPASDPYDPSTWGEHAVICDPWSNLVYPAKEYLSTLQNYYFDEAKNENCVEKFDREKGHYLVPYKQWINLAELRSQRNKYLQAKLPYFKQLPEALETYHTQLTLECKRIYNKNKEDYHPAHDDKLSILYKKIADIKAAKHEVNRIIQFATHPETRDNPFAETGLYHETLTRIWNQALQSMKFSKVEQDKLFGHAREGFLTHAMRFFNVKTATENNIRSIAESIKPLNHH